MYTGELNTESQVFSTIDSIYKEIHSLGEKLNPIILPNLAEDKLAEAKSAETRLTGDLKNILKLLSDLRQSIRL